VAQHLARRRARFRGRRVGQPEFHHLTGDLDRTTGPREKAVDPCRQPARRCREVEPTVLLGEFPAVRRSRVVLRREAQRALGQSRQRPAHQRDTRRAEFRFDLRRRIEGVNRHALDVRHRPGIQSPNDPHQRHAGRTLTARDRGLNRRRAAVFRQQRGVQIQHPESGRAHEVIAQDMTVRHHESDIGLQTRQLQSDVLRQLLRLQHRQGARLGPKFDRIGPNLLSASRRPVRLSKYAYHLRNTRTLSGEPIKYRQGNHIGSEED
jgi:hypothetical protein